jgi:hypothetical protein
MSIQTGGGPIRIDPDDAQMTYRGKTFAIKVRALSWVVIIGCLRQADGTWTSEFDLTDDMFGSDVPGQPDPVAYWIAHFGGADGFVREVIVPRLNTWLALLFPASDQPLTPLEQVQVVLSGIKFKPQPDGTLNASV